MHCFDGSDGAAGEGGVFCRVGEGTRAGVAVRVHPELAVRVNVHVQRDSLAGSYAVELGLEQFSLYAVAGGRAFVVLCTGVG